MKIFLWLLSLVGLGTLVTVLIIKFKDHKLEEIPEEEKTMSDKEVEKIIIKNPVIAKQEIIDGLKAVNPIYRKTIEKMFRNETAHFTSGQFLNTKSAGMEQHGLNFPYGYISMQQFWLKNPKSAPIGMWSAVENNSALASSIGKKTFLKFSTVKDAMLSLQEYLKQYPAGRWFSTTPTQQQAYEKILATIKTPYSDSIA